MSGNVWIGLVEVKALPGTDVLGDALGAFVNVLALAVDEDSFKKTREHLLE